MFVAEYNWGLDSWKIYDYSNRVGRRSNLEKLGQHVLVPRYVDEEVSIYKLW